MADGVPEDCDDSMVVEEKIFKSVLLYLFYFLLVFITFYSFSFYSDVDSLIDGVTDGKLGNNWDDVSNRTKDGSLYYENHGLNIV